MALTSLRGLDHRGRVLPLLVFSIPTPAATAVVKGQPSLPAKATVCYLWSLECSSCMSCISCALN